MASDNYDEKYTEPDLRRRLKQEIQDSDKGGKPGQWSARKSQLLVQEYEKHGGGYQQDKKDEAAKSLEEWTEQNWQTKEGDADAEQDGVMKRYLPEQVWNRLSPEEQQKAERTKQSGDQKDEQYVGWTPAIKRAMAEAGYAPDDAQNSQGTEESLQAQTTEELYSKAQDLSIEGRSQMKKDELIEAICQAQAQQLQKQTTDDLYAKAQALEISGRSQMNKDELIEALVAAGASA